MEYAAVGDTTNVAARLQAATKGTPHALFVSQTTWERLDEHSRVRLQPAGEQAVAGRGQPVPVVRAARRAPAARRLSRGPATSGTKPHAARRRRGAAASVRGRAGRSTSRSPTGITSRPPRRELVDRAPRGTSPRADAATLIAS